MSASEDAAAYNINLLVWIPSGFSKDGKVQSVDQGWGGKACPCVGCRYKAQMGMVLLFEADL